MEGTAFITMAALYAAARLLFQFVIMVTGQLIPGPGQVVIFVDKPHIQSSRTGLTVITIDAFARRVLGRKGAENGVVPFLRGGGKITKQPLKVGPVPNSGQHPDSTPGLSKAYCIHWYSVSAFPKGEVRS